MDFFVQINLTGNYHDGAVSQKLVVAFEPLGAGAHGWKASPLDVEPARAISRTEGSQSVAQRASTASARSPPILERAIAALTRTLESTRSTSSRFTTSARDGTASGSRRRASASVSPPGPPPAGTAPGWRSSGGG